MKYRSLIALAWISSFLLLAGACGSSGEAELDGGSPSIDAQTSGMCGGFTGAQCKDTEYCDYAHNGCGSGDGIGICTARPTACPEIYEPVCACNGTVYSNQCFAYKAGQDVTAATDCTAPKERFACGHRFCLLRGSVPTDGAYCEVTAATSSVPSAYTCKAFPLECSKGPNCICLQGEPCGASNGGTCSGGAKLGLTLECAVR